MNLKGYVSVRDPVPVAVQNLVLRDYCARNGHVYSLADVEFVMPGYSMLEGLLEDLEAFDGVVAYSMWQMPVEHKLPKGKEIHFALENYVLPRDLELVCTLWQIREALK